MGIQELTGILVALKHQLAVPSAGVPELHASIFGPAEHPVSIWCERNAEYEVLVSFKSPCAPPSSSHLAADHAAVLGHQLPHFDGLIQTSTDQALAIGRESDAVYTVGVAVNSFQPTNQVASRHTPDTDALVKGSSCHVVPARRDSDGSDSIFDLESQDLTISFDIPDADGMVAAARSDVAAVAGKVEGVDVLFVAGEGVTDRTTLNVPYLKTTTVISK